MKNLQRIGLAAMLIFLAFTPVTYSFLTNLSTSRHATSVDFSTAREDQSSLIVYAALGYASLALGFAQGENYGSADSVLRQLQLIAFPPQSGEINLKTYIRLVQEFLSIMSSIRTGINRIENITALGEIERAMAELADIDTLMSNANFHLTLLNATLQRVHDIYRVDVTGQRRQLLLFWPILLNYAEQLNSLRMRITDLNHLATTILNFSIFPTSVMIDGTLEVSGQLTVNGVPLAGRVVEIWSNNILAAQVLTDTGGTFTSIYDVNDGSQPYVITIFTKYSPNGQDAYKFRPVQSRTLIIPVIYYPVLLTAASMKSVHVLQDIKLNGSLQDLQGHALSNRTLTIVSDGQIIGNTTTGTSGSYQFDFHYNPPTPQGIHTIVVAFNPARGIYASTTSTLKVTLFYFTSNVTLTQDHALILSGQQISLNGFLSTSSGETNGTVIAALGDQRLGSVQPNANGNFQIVIALPFEMSGPSNITVIYMPSSPWITSSLIFIRLNVVNPTILISGLGAFAVAGTMLARSSLKQADLRKKEKRRRSEVEMLEMHEASQETLQDRFRKITALKETADVRTRITLTYWHIRKMLSKKFSDISIQSETVREYNDRVSNLLGLTANSFAALTHLFEIARYSQHPLNLHDAQAATTYAITVAESLEIQ